MEPNDEQLMGLMPQQLRDDLTTVSRMAAHGAGPDVTPELFEGSLTAGALQFVRAVLAHRGHQPALPVEGEAVKAVRPSRRQLIMLADDMGMASVSEAAEYARAVLARYGHQPAPPTEGEVAELVALIRQIALAWEPDACLLGNMTAGQLARAADLLEQRHPEPVPVSERLPGDALCWWYEPDEDDDDSGYGGRWTLLRIRGGTAAYTHWLPATTLPLPAGEVQP